MIKWFAYRHNNGTIHVKRYFDEHDLRECEESFFVDAHTQPFLASNREEAIEKAEHRLGE